MSIRNVPSNTNTITKTTTQTRGKRAAENSGNRQSKRPKTQSISVFESVLNSICESSTQKSKLEGRTVEVRTAEPRLPTASHPKENGGSYCYEEFMYGQGEFDKGNYSEAIDHFNNIPENSQYYGRAQKAKGEAQRAKVFQIQVESDYFFLQPNQ